MAKKARFRGARHSPKRLESDILERAKAISDNPGMLRPKCAGHCRKCHFDKTFAQLDRLKGVKDAPLLVKHATKGSDDIYKAAAATMSLYAAGSIPFLASARIAGETVPFAVRGRVGNDKLIGAQHFDDPKMRLLLYNNFAKKKGLHMYSFDDEIVCADVPNMPSDYLYDTFWESPYDFPEDGLSCGHDVEGVLVIRIRSLGEEIRICRNCVKDVSTLQYIISRLIANNPMDDIDVYVEHKYNTGGDAGKDPIVGDILEKYKRGEINDRIVMNVVMKEKMNDLKKQGVATYIIGARNFGSDLDSFIDALNGNDVEKKALKAFLSRDGVPVVLRTERASEALGNLWDDHFRDIIAAFTTQDIADGMGDVSKMNPSQTLSNANYQFISSDIVSKLPDFGPRAGIVTKAADRFAKAVKVGGESLLKREIEAAGVKDYKSRSVARAFIMATSSNTSAGWKYSAEEEDFAKYLMQFVKGLIDAEGESYRDAMNTLLTASGSGESV